MSVVEVYQPKVERLPDGAKGVYGAGFNRRTRFGIMGRLTSISTWVHEYTEESIHMIIYRAHPLLSCSNITILTEFPTSKSLYCIPIPHLITSMVTSSRIYNPSTNKFVTVSPSKFYRVFVKERISMTKNKLRAKDVLWMIVYGKAKQLLWLLSSKES